MSHAEPISPPLSRPYPVADLLRDGETRVKIDASPAEEGRIAAFLGLTALEDLSATMRVQARAGRRIVLSGEVSARVTQACVVTGEPVVSTLKCPVYREFDDSGDTAREEDLDPLAEDPPDIVEDGVIDPGAVVVETLALEIDPYPRSENAPPGDYDDDAGKEDAARDHPFAALGELLKKGE